MIFSDKKTCNNCAHRHTLSSSCTFFSVTGFPPQRIALLPRCLSWRQRSCLFEGLAAAGNIICSMVGCVSHPHSFGVVCPSLRLLAVLSGDEPEANVSHRILACGAAIGALEGHTCGAETDTFATSNLQHVDQLHRASILRAAAFARFPEHAVRIGPPRNCGTGFAVSLSQRWRRQEQKLFFTSLLWHVEQVCTFMSCLVVYHPRASLFSKLFGHRHACWKIKHLCHCRASLVHRHPR